MGVVGGAGSPSGFGSFKKMLEKTLSPVGGGGSINSARL